MELLKDYDGSIQYHPGKDNMVANALSRKSSGSLAYINAKRRTMIKELYDLMDRGVFFQIFDEGVLLANIRICSVLFDRIKAAQSQDPNFELLWKISVVDIQQILLLMKKVFLDSMVDCVFLKWGT